MQITIPAPTTYTKVDDGVYRGSDNNLYHDETVLRYRVMRKHLIEPYSESGWGLYTSHADKDSAITCMFDSKEKTGEVYDYKFVDAGEPTTIKRLLY